MNMIKDRRWVNPNDPGILRKKNDENSDLFVFGYSCKIFRDDQRALEMDQGKQLIPWMGDESLKIDRYDARGHLSELSPYEGASQVYVPTAEERKIEALCDEERYRALSLNEEESLLYQEEELKRLKQLLNTEKTYGQVEYHYKETTTEMSDTDNNLEVPETDDDEFIPSSLLDIPPQMFLPRTVRENQIIEKTAAHVAVHGPQVEIVIKTRQANNAKLNFLHVDSPLYPYYQLVLSNIKSGRFHTPRSLPTTTESDQDHYLHPSLVSTVESAPSIPSIPYKPSSDCAYNALVKNIRTVQEAAEQPREEPTRLTQDSSSSESHHTFEEMSTQENPAIWGNRSPRLLTPPDHLFTTSSGSSPGTPSAVEQPKKKRRPPRTIFPANKAKRLISGMVKYAYRTNQDPSSLLNELGGSGPNINFTQPGHLFYDYYKKQYKVTFKTTTSPKSYPPANGTATVSALPVTATATCTGGTDKEPSTSEPQNSDISFNESSDLHSVGAKITEENLSPVLAQKTQTPQESRKNVEKLPQTVPPKSKISVPQTARLKVGYEKVSTALTEKTKCSTPQPTVGQSSQPSSSGEGNTRIGKPAPVSFSIKKSKEERLEHASIFPLEESSSEEDEEVKEIKNTQPKVETDKSQMVERQQSPMKDHAHSNDDLDLSALIDGLKKVQEESVRSKKKGGEKTNECTGQKRTRDSSKETKAKEVGANGKYTSLHPVAVSTTSARAEEKRSKSPSKGDTRKSPKTSTKGEEKRKDVTSKSEDKKTSRSTSREHNRKRKHERKEAPNSPLKMPKKTMEVEEDDFFSDLVSGLDYPNVSFTSQESMDKKANENKKKEERKRKVKEMLAKLSQTSQESASTIYLSTQSSEKSTDEIVSSPESTTQILEGRKEESTKAPAEETEEMMRQRVREALIRYNKAASEKFPLYKDRPNSPLSVHIRSAPMHLMSSTIKKIEEEKEKHKKSPTPEKFNPTGIWDPENPVPSTSNSTDIRYGKENESKTKARRPCRPPPGFDPLPANVPDELTLLDFLMKSSTSSNTSNTRYRSAMEDYTATETERPRTVNKSEKTETRTSTKKKSSYPKSPDLESNRFSHSKIGEKSSKIEDIYTKKKSHKKHSHKSKKYRKKVDKHTKQSKRSRSASSSSD